MPTIDNTSILRVVEACGCTENRARSLLTVTGGDIDSAVDLFSLASPRAPKASNPTPPSDPPAATYPTLPGSYPSPTQPRYGRPDVPKRRPPPSVRPKPNVKSPSEPSEEGNTDLKAAGQLSSHDGESIHEDTSDQSTRGEVRDTWLQIPTPPEDEAPVSGGQHDPAHSLQPPPPLVHDPPLPPVHDPAPPPVHEPPPPTVHEPPPPVHETTTPLGHESPPPSVHETTTPPVHESPPPSIHETSTPPIHESPPPSIHETSTPPVYESPPPSVYSRPQELPETEESESTEIRDKDTPEVSDESDKVSTIEPGSAEPLQRREWDFVLPVIEPPVQLNPGGSDGASPFSLRELIGAMQHGANHNQVRAYLVHQDQRTTKGMIKAGQVEGFPVMFYAVATNDEWIIREFARFDGDVNSVYGDDKIPLLAFAVINSENRQEETTPAVATLLSLGANADVIPKAFYSPFCVDLPDSGPDEDGMPDLEDDKRRWCTSEVARRKLAKNLNLTQRYYMEKSTKIKKPSIRAWQIAKLRAAEPLLGIPYFLIGQTAASSLVIDHLLNYMARGVVHQSKRPLVMVFAGPSGHGKTELARKLGHLLSLEIEVVDCTTFSREDELFGPRAPYRGSDKGSPLNNFLAKNSGQRCIVFLDEFEKTSPDIHNALLIPFDKGEYEDRRHRTTVNCSRTIWVLATNAIDEKIMEFCAAHKSVIFNDEDHSERPPLIKKLSKVIKQEFKEQFKPPITGRVSAFLPFLPFSPGEQAVGAHKYLLEYAQEVRRPVSLQPGLNEQLIGGIRLHIRRDASVCRLIAAEGYDGDLGIRSLINAVRDTVELSLFESYLEVEKYIEEGQQIADYVVGVRNDEIAISTVSRKDDEER